MYHMEMTLEQPPEKTTDRTDTITVNLDVESGDIATTMSSLYSQYYPAEMCECSIFLLDEDEDDG